MRPFLTLNELLDDYEAHGDILVARQREIHLQNMWQALRKAVLSPVIDAIARRSEVAVYWDEANSEAVVRIISFGGRILLTRNRYTPPFWTMSHHWLNEPVTQVNDQLHEGELTPRLLRVLAEMRVKDRARAKHRAQAMYGEEEETNEFPAGPV